MDHFSFGKYKGTNVVFVNSGYLKWLLDQDWFPEHRDYDMVEEEINRRDHEFDHFYEDKVQV